MSEALNVTLQLSSASGQARKIPSWRRYLEKAMLESNPIKLLPLIHKTELALFRRWQELREGEDGRECEEMMVGAADLRQLQVRLNAAGLDRSSRKKRGRAAVRSDSAT